MKLKLLITTLLLTSVSFAQFTTPVMTFNSTPGSTFLFSGKIEVNATTVTVTLIGPSTSWLGLGFGATSMSSGTGDVVLFDGTTLSDRTFTGGFSQPTIDANQSWTLTSNTVSGSTRTVVGTRALNSGDSGDYIFTNSNAPITLVYARGQSLTVGYHGGDSCGTTVANFTTLGVEDFSLNASSIFPNPSNGEFTVSTKTNLSEINVYSQTGALVKTITVENSSTKVDIVVDNLQSGVYLIELKNNSEKSWKKVIVN